MRILLTNDDGITSPGISLLAQALRKAGHRVFVLAPDSDRSGFSHSISFLNAPCKITEIERDTWSCSGTPADCVVMALLGGIPEICVVDGTPPDLVLSGINRGANIGTDIIYSGTAAAARQGGIGGIPAVALSLIEGDGSWYWDVTIAFIVEHLEEMRNYWKANTFVNVNFPNTAQGASALVPAFPSVRYYNDGIVTYAAPGGGLYCFARAGKIQTTPEAGSDWDVVLKHGAAMSAVIIQPVSKERA
ncbi:hypothetical protein AGMMS50293_27930 [Spirochaetia bacterium]|nr:hypothetical protein AGMMS50293_27930 [Spirochaetia bacterium]